MADTVEPQGGPPAVDQTGNLVIWAIPGDTEIDLDALTVDDLDAVTAVRITYSFTPDGYALTLPQEKTDDPRLTASQRKQALGRVNPELQDLKYVDSSDEASAAQILKNGGPWVLVERRNVPNTTLATAGQIVRGLQLTLGVQAPGPTDGTGKFTKTQVAVVEYVGPEHALTAGSVPAPPETP